MSGKLGGSVVGASSKHFFFAYLDVALVDHTLDLNFGWYFSVCLFRLIGYYVLI